MKTTNTNREQVLSLLSKATSKVQIAVSWLTDEMLIDKLVQTARRVKVDVLLSGDPLNTFRYSDIRRLQQSGARVLKAGAAFPGQGGFMHAKYMIVDDSLVYGGSFNFTVAANQNMENFGRYDQESINDLRRKFESWFSTAIDYTIGFENPDAIQALVREQFAQNEAFRAKLLDTTKAEYRQFVDKQVSEREMLISEEVKKEHLRTNTANMQAGESKVTQSGSLSSREGVASKPHRFYGGRLLSVFRGSKEKNSYAKAMIQKREIETKYNFLKCTIIEDTLICTGTLKPDSCDTYKIRIEYRAGAAPRVFVLDPRIAPNPDIHMYKEGSLCLFYPSDLQWKARTSIAEYTIPWVLEWIMYYELYLLTGKWEGESVAHGSLTAMV